MAAPQASIPSRRRPLHTCASSMLGVIDTAYRRSQQLNGPLGNFIKRLTASSSVSKLPYASKMQHLGLTVLSLTDDHILFFERVTESVFPPSKLVFDKIDMLVYSAEGLPRKFDEALDNFPNMMHQIPFLDWVLMHVIWWLNFLISSLNHWGSKHAKEKEIMIDKSFETCSNTPFESSPKKTDSSGAAPREKEQEQPVFEFIESPVKAKPKESTDKEENIDDARGRSMMRSNELVESTTDTEGEEARDQSIMGSNEFVESADKENLDEARGQSMVGSQELVETPDSVATEEKSMLSNSEEEPGSAFRELDEKPAETEEEKKDVQLPNTEESENKTEDDDQTNTTLSPTESFQSAQFDHVISPSPTHDSFHEAETIELPTTDEDETKEKSLPRISSGNKPGKEKSSSTSPTTTTSSSSGKNKAKKGKKATEKDEKKTEDKVEEHKILELLEAKWHMM